MLKNLRELRLENNLTQAKLALMIGVSQQSINKYENHGVEPDTDVIRKIADTFNVSTDYLIGNTEIRHPIEKLTPYDLNEKELEVMEEFRKLSLQEKDLIEQLIKSYNNKNR